MKRLRNLAIVVAALIVVVVVAVVASRQGDRAALAVPMQRLRVTAFTVRLPENGVVMRPLTATIPALVAGNIAQIYVRAGQNVTAGQLLATVYNPSLSYTAAGSHADFVSANANVDLARTQERNARVGYQAQVDTNKSALDEAERVYEADLALYKNQAIPRQQLDQDRAKRDQAKVAYDQSVEQLKLGAVTSYSGDSIQYAIAAATKARIVDAQNQQQLAFSRIVAPFDGVIQTVATQVNDALRTAQPGDAVTAGQSLFTIAGGGGYIVRAEVDEQDIINVRLGQQANVTGQDFPGKVIRGHVTDIAPVATKSTDASSTAKQVLTTISLDSSPSFLKDGMTADVDILTTYVPHAIVVPNDAVTTHGSRSSVYVVVNGIAQKRPVGIGKTGDTHDLDYFRAPARRRCRHEQDRRTARRQTRQARAVALTFPVVTVLLSYFEEAVAALWRNRVRSILTMLGMIIGSASIIAVFGISRAATSGITNTFASFGQLPVYISVDNSQDEPQRAAMQYRDAAAVSADLGDRAAAVLPLWQRTYHVAFGNVARRRNGPVGQRLPQRHADDVRGTQGRSRGRCKRRSGLRTHRRSTAQILWR